MSRLSNLVKKETQLTKSKSFRDDSEQWVFLKKKKKKHTNAFLSLGTTSPRVSHPCRSMLWNEQMWWSSAELLAASCSVPHTPRCIAFWYVLVNIQLFAMVVTCCYVLKTSFFCSTLHEHYSLFEQVRLQTFRNVPS